MTPPPLSPAAQAVWDAWNDAYEAQGPLEDMGYPLAAALIAAAKQIDPTIEERRVRQHGRHPAFYQDFNNGISCAAAQLLALAAELRQEGRA